MLRWFGYIALGVLIAVLTALVLAPAQWLAEAAAGATDGRIQLTEAAGTIWNGRATVVLAPAADESAARVALPERLTWRVAPMRLAIGQLDVTLAHPSALAQPLVLRSALLSGQTEVGPTTLRLPAAVLAGLGAPFNTLKPGGLISLTWQRLTFDDGRASGDISIDWQFATSSLTAVAPFGSYRLTATGGYPGTRLNLMTLAGPLELTGNGTIDDSGRVRFSGRARATSGSTPELKNQLSGFISLLGRREGDTALLRLGN